MPLLRTVLSEHRRFAIVLLALAMCMKLMVPAGFMIGAGGKSLSITICNGHGPELTKRIGLPQTGQFRHGSADRDKTPDACPFAALAVAGLMGAHPWPIMVRLAFLLLRQTWAAAFPQPALQPFLRPPLRAPPFAG